MKTFLLVLAFSLRVQLLDFACLVNEVVKVIVLGLLLSSQVMRRHLFRGHKLLLVFRADLVNLLDKVHLQRKLSRADQGIIDSFNLLRWRRGFTEDRIGLLLDSLHLETQVGLDDRELLGTLHHEFAKAGALEHGFRLLLCDFGEIGQSDGGVHGVLFERGENLGLSSYNFLNRSRAADTGLHNLNSLESRLLGRTILLLEKLRDLLLDQSLSSL